MTKPGDGLALMSESEIYELAEKAVSDYSDKIQKWIREGERRRTMRQQYQLSRGRVVKYPSIALCGPSRCGKDTAARFLSSVYELEFHGSLSKLFMPLVAAVIGTDEQTAYKYRHDYRRFLRIFFDGVRRSDPALLVRVALSKNDIIAGIRSSIELDAAVTDGLLDLTIWIDRDVNGQTDPTIDYGAEDCDVVICNETGITEFYSKLRTLCELIGVPERAGLKKE